MHSRCAPIALQLEPALALITPSVSPESDSFPHPLILQTAPSHSSLYPLSPYHLPDSPLLPLCSSALFPLRAMSAHLSPLASTNMDTTIQLSLTHQGESQSSPSPITHEAASTSAAKRFPCRVCKKPFSSSSNRIRHERKQHCCTPKKEYRRRRQRVRCLLTAYAVEGFLCGQTAKEDLPPLAAAKLAGRRGVRGTPAAWRTSDALYSTSSTISSSASIFSSSISFSFSSRALKSITKSL